MTDKAMSTLRRRMAERATDLLPVPYYHVLFTLPVPIGDVVAHPILGGLHHRYARI